MHYKCDFCLMYYKILKIMVLLIINKLNLSVYHYQPTHPQTSVLVGN